MYGLKNLDVFFYWIGEREKIRRAKEAGEPKPWTEDPILQKYRFCNVRRMDDRVSRWLFDRWYEPEFDCSNMLTACTIARLLNLPESLEAIGFPRQWKPHRVEKILEERKKQGCKTFNSAYIITGCFGGSKIHQVVWWITQPIHKDRHKIVDRTSMRATWQNLLAYPGIKSFLAGQIVADLRWAINHEWKDQYTWAPLGPGSRRGMNRLLERPKSRGMGQEEFDGYFGSLIEEGKDRDGWVLAETMERMEAIDWQNCLCEFDKYMRALTGQGKPKQKYAGVE